MFFGINYQRETDTHAYVRQVGRGHKRKRREGGEMVPIYLEGKGSHVLIY